MLEIKMLEIISILNFVESCLWSVLENILCAVEKNVYSAYGGMKTSITMKTQLYTIYGMQQKAFLKGSSL